MLTVLTPAEVAKRLNVSLDFVYRRLRDGEIAAFKFGEGSSTWRVPEDELNSYLRRSARTDELSAVGNYFHGSRPESGR